MIFANDENICPIPDVEILEVDKRHCQLIFDRNKVHINDLMSYLLSTYSVKDMSIAEPDIDSIIRKIYSSDKVA